MIQTFQTDWVESSTKSSLVIKNYCSTDDTVSIHPSCTSLLYQLSILTMIYFIIVFKSFSKNLCCNVCQLHTYFTLVNLVHFAFFTIPHKMYSSSNVTCVLGILTTIIHTNIRLAIQYNYRSFLWNYIWILVQQFIN